MFFRRRTRRQLIISLATGVGAVTILAIMVGSLSQSQLAIGTAIMALIGLVGIWLFDSEESWSWPSDASDYLTIVGLLGFWEAISDALLDWVIAIICYWALATLVRRARYAR